MSEKLNSRQQRKLAAEEHQRQREKKEADRVARIATRLAEQNSGTPQPKTPGDIAVTGLMHALATVGQLIQPTLFGRGKRFK